MNCELQILRFGLHDGLAVTFSATCKEVAPLGMFVHYWDARKRVVWGKLTSAVKRADEGTPNRWVAAPNADVRFGS